MQRLREETRRAHMQIEGALPLLDPLLTRLRYGGVMRAFYGFYAVLEPRLLAAAGAHGAHIELGRRAKLPLLLLDLRALGETDAQLAALPRCEELPSTATPSHALGALYVIEGATLGGQVIGRSLKASLGVDATNGAAFFSGYGVETRPMWQRFAAHLDQEAALDTELVVTSAVDTFDKLRVWLVAAAKS